jgi:hypothetical protein
VGARIFPAWRDRQIKAGVDSLNAASMAIFLLPLLRGMRISPQTLLRKKEDLNKGVIFKPIAGNAVFWENMRSDGSGYAESWHAGLPVTKGVKIGLNIWSWLAEGYVPGHGDA